MYISYLLEVALARLLCLLGKSVMNGYDFPKPRNRHYHKIPNGMKPTKDKTDPSTQWNL